MQSGNMASLLFFPARWSRRIMSLWAPNKLAKVLWSFLITSRLNLMVIDIQCDSWFDSGNTLVKSIDSLVILSLRNDPLQIVR